MRIGIFGGSFDPIHTGHAIIAHHIISSGAVDKLLMMVSPVNPLKAGNARHVTDADRLRMVELVSRPLGGVETSALEFTLPRPSYTINTLNALQEKFPDDELSLVIGADNWAAFDRWRSGDEIVAKHRVIVYPRLGHEVVIPGELSDRVTLIDAPVIELSSTMIRERIASGKGARYYVPDAVLEYIESHHLYHPADNQSHAKPLSFF